jgi:AcrR family transcriptional regulator
VSANPPAAEADPPALADISGMKSPPTTRRGARTRAALVDAARLVFERDGFLRARITDIPAAANCSTGTFYTYFSSKEEIFTAVLEAAQDDMLHPGMAHVEDSSDPVAVIEASNRAYLLAFLRNAKLMVLMQQVALIDPKFRALRRRRAAIFAERNARHIADLQTRGLADPTLDPLLTSMALSGMVSRVALDVLVYEEADVDAVVDVVNKLWVNGLRLARPS